MLDCGVERRSGGVEEEEGGREGGITTAAHADCVGGRRDSGPWTRVAPCILMVMGVLRVLCGAGFNFML